MLEAISPSIAPLRATFDAHWASGWPTWNHTLLLRAALLSGTEAHAAWTAWSADLDLDAIDPGAQRIIPLLSQNLKALGVTHPDLPRLDGVRRLTWFKTQQLLRAAAPVLRAFHEAGMPTLLLKGSAALIRDYPDESLRPMYDLDLAVPFEDALPAIDRMHTLGWHPYAEDSADLTAVFIAAHHGVGFANADGLKIDLHWHALKHEKGTDVNAAFWSQALPATLRDAPTHTLCPTDHLLHTCIHGINYKLIALPLQWVPDAVLLLRRTDAIDWARFVQLARTMRVTLLAHTALSYLHHCLDVPLPADVLHDLKETPTTLIDRLAYRRRTRPVEAQRWTFLLPFLRHRQQLAGRSLTDQTRAWHAFLRNAWDLTPDERLLPTLLRRGTRRLSRFVAGRL